MPFTTSSRTLFYNKKLFAQAGISRAPADLGRREGRRAEDQGARARSASGCRSARRRRRPSRCCGCSATAAATRTSPGNWTIDSPQNVETFNFLKGLVTSGATEPNPGTKNRTDLWKQFAQGGIGMINGSPALIPIIKVGQGARRLRLDLGADRRQDRPADQHAGRVRLRRRVQERRHGKQAAIKKFLDFAYQDKYQVAVRQGVRAAAGHHLGASTRWPSDPVFAPFLKALPNAVQYPSSTGLGRGEDADPADDRHGRHR